jgi:hypothetical protein
MIPVSIVDWQYIPWVKKWDKVFEISISDFQKLKSWLAVIVDWEILELQTLKKETKKETKKELEIKEKAIKSEKILCKYTITDQINHIRRILQTLSEDEELHEMWEFIDWILKWDLSSINE